MKKMLLFILISVFMLMGTSCTNSDLNFLKKEAANPYEYNYKEINEENYINYLNKLKTFYSTLSSDIYSEFGDDYSNICISPISIYMALSLVVECTNSNTRQEILDAIGVTYEELLQYTKLIYSQLNSLDKEGNKVLLQEILTNSIWFDESIVLKDIGLTSLSENFNCSSYSTPFRTNNKTANKALKDFVKKNTNGLINNDFNLDPNTLIALVNTFYLKEVWDYEDDLSFTNDKYTFTNYDKTTKKLELLKGYYNQGRVYEADMYNSFYTMTAHGYYIKFIVPKNEYNVDDIYTKDILEEIMNMNGYNALDEENKKIYKTRCFFPEFKANFNEDIKSILEEQMNIKTLFTTSADFSNITSEDVFGLGVVHQTKLNVDKKGIEGAAVTIVMVGDASVGEYEVIKQDFIIDRDFAFVIHDYSGNVVFTGVVKEI